MTGETAHRPPLVARGFDRSVVFAPGHAEHAVGPEAVAQPEDRMVVEILANLGRIVVVATDNRRLGVCENAARTVTSSRVRPVFSLRLRQEDLDAIRSTSDRT